MTLRGMTAPHVTVRETVVVRRPPNDVWDSTRDDADRTAWDLGVRAVDLAPLVERSMRANTRTAMRRAKGILEAR